MATVLYRQCRLEKKIPQGVSVQTSWIPAEFARAGKVVKLRDADGHWDDGWVVAHVGAEMAEDDLDERRNLQRKYRCTKDD